ncbi:MAG TPA: prolipoprotein diacylglyceryl transferase family protein [Caulobacteraceae bacterium]|nr:prolipoprotein diacylglyceryl transferase family protein [Caulobacteraceae bacterium]
MILVATSPAVHPLFDLAAWAAGAASGWAIWRWRLKGAALSLAARAGPGYFVALAAGAVTGAWLAGSLNTLRGPDPTLSHSIAGAMAGAIVAVEIYKAARGIRGSTGGVFVGSLAVGVIVGRFGCLFAGLADRTYGTPTALPWAVNLGDGIGRHPVQIYESLAMALFLAVYLAALRVRAPWALRRGFYVAVAWYGAQRFVWEFLKPYPRVIGPFNLFHLISPGLVLYGCVWFVRDRRLEAAGAQGRALPLPRPDHEPV